METVTPEQADWVRSHCPCGNKVVLEEQVFVEGILGSGKEKVIAHYLAPRYHHRETNRFLCSAECSLRWNEVFWRPYQEHIK
jgi:hypothetical protein